MLKENKQIHTTDIDNYQQITYLLDQDSIDALQNFLDGHNFYKNQMDKEKLILTRLCTALGDKGQLDIEGTLLQTQLQKAGWGSTTLANKLKRNLALLNDARDQLNAVLKHHGNNKNERPNR